MDSVLDWTLCSVISDTIHFLDPQNISSHESDCDMLVLSVDTVPAINA